MALDNFSVKLMRSIHQALGVLKSSQLALYEKAVDLSAALDEVVADSLGSPAPPLPSTAAANYRKFINTGTATTTGALRPSDNPEDSGDDVTAAVAESGQSGREFEGEITPTAGVLFLFGCLVLVLYVSTALYRRRRKLRQGQLREAQASKLHRPNHNAPEMRLRPAGASFTIPVYFRPHFEAGKRPSRRTGAPLTSPEEAAAGGSGDLESEHLQICTEDDLLEESPSLQTDINSEEVNLDRHEASLSYHEHLQQQQQQQLHEQHQHQQSSTTATATTRVMASKKLATATRTTQRRSLPRLMVGPSGKCAGMTGELLVYALDLSAGEQSEEMEQPGAAAVPGTSQDLASSPASSMPRQGRPARSSSPRSGCGRDPSSSHQGHDRFPAPRHLGPDNTAARERDRPWRPRPHHAPQPRAAPPCPRPDANAFTTTTTATTAAISASITHPPPVPHVADADDGVARESGGVGGSGGKSSRHRPRSVSPRVDHPCTQRQSFRWRSSPDKSQNQKSSRQIQIQAPLSHTPTAKSKPNFEPLEPNGRWAGGLPRERICEIRQKAKENEKTTKPAALDPPQRQRATNRARSATTHYLFPFREHQSSSRRPIALQRPELPQTTKGRSHRSPKKKEVEHSSYRGKSNTVMNVDGRPRFKTDWPAFFTTISAKHPKKRKTQGKGAKKKHPTTSRKAESRKANIDCHRIESAAPTGDNPVLPIRPLASPVKPPQAYSGEVFDLRKTATPNLSSLSGRGAFVTYCRESQLQQEECPLADKVSLAPDHHMKEQRTHSKAREHHVLNQGFHGEAFDHQGTMQTSLTSGHHRTEQGSLNESSEHATDNQTSLSKTRDLVDTGSSEPDSVGELPPVTSGDTLPEPAPVPPDQQRNLARHNTRFLNTSATEPPSSSNDCSTAIDGHKTPAAVAGWLHTDFHDRTLQGRVRNRECHKGDIALKPDVSLSKDRCFRFKGASDFEYRHNNGQFSTSRDIVNNKSVDRSQRFKRLQEMWSDSKGTNPSGKNKKAQTISLSQESKGKSFGNPFNLKLREHGDSNQTKSLSRSKSEPRRARHDLRNASPLQFEMPMQEPLFSDIVQTFKTPLRTAGPWCGKKSGMGAYLEEASKLGPGSQPLATHNLKKTSESHKTVTGPKASDEAPSKLKANTVFRITRNRVTTLKTQKGQQVKVATDSGPQTRKQLLQRQGKAGEREVTLGAAHKPQDTPVTPPLKTDSKAIPKKEQISLFPCNVFRTVQLKNQKPREQKNTMHESRVDGFNSAKCKGQTQSDGRNCSTRRKFVRNTQPNVIVSKPANQKGFGDTYATISDLSGPLFVMKNSENGDPASTNQTQIKNKSTHQIPRPPSFSPLSENQQGKAGFTFRDPDLPPDKSCITSKDLAGEVMAHRFTIDKDEDGLDQVVQAHPDDSSSKATSISDFQDTSWCSPCDEKASDKAPLKQVTMKKSRQKQVQKSKSLLSVSDILSKLSGPAFFKTTCHSPLYNSPYRTGKPTSAYAKHIKRAAHLNQTLRRQNAAIDDQTTTTSKRRSRRYAAKEASTESYFGYNDTGRNQPLSQEGSVREDYIRYYKMKKSKCLRHEPYQKSTSCRSRDGYKVPRSHLRYQARNRNNCSPLHKAYTMARGPVLASLPLNGCVSNSSGTLSIPSDLRERQTKECLSSADNTGARGARQRESDGAENEICSFSLSNRSAGVQRNTPLKPPTWNFATSAIKTRVSRGSGPEKKRAKSLPSSVQLTSDHPTSTNQDSDSAAATMTQVCWKSLTARENSSGVHLLQETNTDLKENTDDNAGDGEKPKNGNLKEASMPGELTPLFQRGQADSRASGSDPVSPPSGPVTASHMTQTESSGLTSLSVAVQTSPGAVGGTRHRAPGRHRCKSSHLLQELMRHRAQEMRLGRASRMRHSARRRASHTNHTAGPLTSHWVLQQNNMNRSTVTENTSLFGDFREDRFGVMHLEDKVDTLLYGAESLKKNGARQILPLHYDGGSFPTGSNQQNVSTELSQHKLNNLTERRKEIPCSPFHCTNTKQNPDSVFGEQWSKEDTHGRKQESCHMSEGNCKGKDVSSVSKDCASSALESSVPMTPLGQKASLHPGESASSRTSELHKMCLLRPSWKNVNIEEVDRRVKRALRLRRELQLSRSSGGRQDSTTLTYGSESGTMETPAVFKTEQCVVVKKLNTSHESETPAENLGIGLSTCQPKSPLAYLYCRPEGTEAVREMGDIQRRRKFTTHHDNNFNKTTQECLSNETETNPRKGLITQAHAAFSQTSEDGGAPTQATVAGRECSRQDSFLHTERSMSLVDLVTTAAADIVNDHGRPASAHAAERLDSMFGNNNLKRGNLGLKYNNSPPAKQSKRDKPALPGNTPRLVGSLVQRLPQVPLSSFVEWFIETSDPKHFLSSEKSRTSSDDKTSGSKSASGEDMVSTGKNLEDVAASSVLTEFSHCRIDKPRCTAESTYPFNSNTKTPTNSGKAGDSGRKFRKRNNSHERVTRHSLSHFKRLTAAASSHPETTSSHKLVRATAKTNEYTGTWLRECDAQKENDCTKGQSINISGSDATCSAALLKSTVWETETVETHSEPRHEERESCGDTHETGTLENTSSYDLDTRGINSRTYTCEEDDTVALDKTIDTNRMYITCPLRSSTDDDNEDDDDDYNNDNEDGKEDGEDDDADRNENQKEEKPERRACSNLPKCVDRQGRKLTPPCEEQKRVSKLCTSGYESKDKDRKPAVARSLSKLLDTSRDIENFNRSDKIRLALRQGSDGSSEGSGKDLDPKCAPGIRHILMKLKESESSCAPSGDLKTQSGRLRITLRRSSDVSGIVAKFQDKTNAGDQSTANIVETCNGAKR